MKLLSSIISPSSQVKHPFVFWLLLCPDSHDRLQPLSRLRQILKKYLLIALLFCVGHYFYQILLRDLGNPFFVRSYLAVPMLFLMSEVLVGFVTLIWLPSGKILPELHDRPWKSRSLEDFWGRRWNLWYSDWTRSTIFRPLRKRKPYTALALAFFTSGILHEWVINVPLYLCTGNLYFGLMMVYFVGQFFGITVERRYFRNRKYARVFFWFCIIGPIPFVIHEGLLRTMHLWFDSY